MYVFLTQMTTLTSFHESQPADNFNKCSQEVEDEKSNVIIFHKFIKKLKVRWHLNSRNLTYLHNYITIELLCKSLYFFCNVLSRLNLKHFEEVLKNVTVSIFSARYLVVYWSHFLVL